MLSSVSQRGVHEIYYPDAQHRLLYFPSDFFKITLHRVIKNTCYFWHKHDVEMACHDITDDKK